MGSVTAIHIGKNTNPVSWPVWIYERFCDGGTSRQSLFAPAVRLYWRWQLAQTACGKLHHLAQIPEFFRSVGIPCPAFSAHFISGLEFLGGLLLIAGLASRLTSFYGADPYTFLFASLLVLIFGAGFFSLDAAIAKRWRKRA
jgi:putative oxidoreductase